MQKLAVCVNHHTVFISFSSAQPAQNESIEDECISVDTAALPLLTCYSSSRLTITQQTKSNNK